MSEENSISLNERDREAAVRLLQFMELDSDEVGLDFALGMGYLTENYGSDHRRYLWYLDEAFSAIIDPETMKVSEDPDVIESLFGSEEADNIEELLLETVKLY